MIGIEFVQNGDPRQPDGDLCAAIIKGCSENGLILLSAGTFKKCSSYIVSTGNHKRTIKQRIRNNRIRNQKINYHLKENEIIRNRRCTDENFSCSTKLRDDEA